MNIRGWLAIGAAVAASSLALAGPAVASAATSAPARSATSGAGSAAPAAIAGVIPAPGAQPGARAAAQPAASCKEPDCNVARHGGPVQHKIRLYVVFWGPTWKTNKTEKAVTNYLARFYGGLGESRDGWIKTVDQYGDGSGHPSFGYQLLGGVYFDKNKPQKTVTFADLAAEAKKTAAHFGVTVANSLNTQVVVAAQSGTCFAEIQGLVFAGNCGKADNVSNSYCAWHSATTYSTKKGTNWLTFTDLPFMLNAPGGCGSDWVNKSGTLDGFSLAGGHEFAETVTDPLPPIGWIDLNDHISGGEVADKCAWKGELWHQSPPDPMADITLSTGKFAVQSLWSNEAHKCVM